ncbi:SGNH/GDSL hydrolase family protein [Plantibacter sp. YIM 135347]|uniref:SGNH/GDSL hydrolase family protein n=1 Tax=Plantibacter sp. YIM 135347 TaxID=3423919 RepID=UPI003D355133
MTTRRARTEPTRLQRSRSQRPDPRESHVPIWIRVRTALFAALAVATVGIGLAGCATAGVQGNDPGPVGSNEGEPLVAFYGDSYTLGTGASDPAKRWSTIICQERGWREFNPSVNGLGFVNNRNGAGEGSGDLPSLIIEQHPDIVFVTMGLNDNFSFDIAADRIHSQIDADLTRLHDALPEARFIVVEPFWYTDERPASLQTISDWVADAAKRIGADTVPGASHWIEGHPEWMAADGLHPNNDGYAHMASEMDKALSQLQL